MIEKSAKNEVSTLAKQQKDVSSHHSTNMLVENAPNRTEVIVQGSLQAEFEAQRIQKADFLQSGGQNILTDTESQIRHSSILVNNSDVAQEYTLPSETLIPDSNQNHLDTLYLHLGFTTDKMNPVASSTGSKTTGKNTDSTPQFANTLPKTVPTYLNNLEVNSDDQVIETFGELIALINYSETGVNSPTYENFDFSVEEPANQLIIIGFGHDMAKRVNSFEEMVRKHPPRELGINIDSIRASANEQPLEETFVQLASILPENSKQIEEIKTALAELSEILFKVDDETDSESMLLSTESISKILALINTLGYDNPKQALLKLVSGHDLPFLAQNMKYLTQAASRIEKHEILSDPQDNSLLAIFHKSIYIYVGRVVLAEVKSKMFATQLVAA